MISHDHGHSGTMIMVTQVEILNVFCILLDTLKTTKPLGLPQHQSQLVAAVAYYELTAPACYQVYLAIPCLKHESMPDIPNPTPGFPQFHLHIQPKCLYKVQLRGLGGPMGDAPSHSTVSSVWQTLYGPVPHPP